MTIACIIPARFNSSRFPGKLLATVLGKTVLERTFESALQHFSLSEVFVATDDERIAAHVRTLGGQAIFTSVSCPNGTDRIAEAVAKFPGLEKAQIIVNLQGDHPCIKPSTLKAAIEALLSDPAASMSTVATPLKSLADFLSPHVVKVVVDAQSNALYFSRSPIPHAKPNTVPPSALHHIGLYCFRREFLLEYAAMGATALQMQEDLEQLKALENGHRIKVAIVNEQAIAVDTPQDLAQLEKYLIHKLPQKAIFGCVKVP
jgi:3-deoxy-manno-octulosonate cytidylyltransferase (CMP-KDO synthetase)